MCHTENKFYAERLVEAVW